METEEAADPVDQIKVELLDLGSDPEEGEIIELPLPPGQLPTTANQQPPHPRPTQPAPAPAPVQSLPTQRPATVQTMPTKLTPPTPIPPVELSQHQTTEQQDPAAQPIQPQPPQLQQALPQPAQIRLIQPQQHATLNAPQQQLQPAQTLQQPRPALPPPRRPAQRHAPNERGNRRGGQEGRCRRHHRRMCRACLPFAPLHVRTNVLLEEVAQNIFELCGQWPSTRAIRNFMEQL